jgi:hypothetical protein
LPPDSVEVLVGEVEIEALVHLGDRDAAVYRVNVLAQRFDGCLVLVELVLNLPDQFLKDVFYRDQTLDASPLVDDYGHLELALLELAQYLLYPLILGNDKAVADQGLEVEVFGLLLGGSE